MPKCIRCAAELAPPYQYCATCGAPQGSWGPSPGYPPPQKRNHTALIIVVVVLVSVPVMAAILYVMTSGLTYDGGTSKPVVTFGSLSVTAHRATFPVTGATPVVFLDSYKFNLMSNGVWGTIAVSLTSGPNTVNVGTTSFWVNYTDVSGNGNLKAGDIFQVQAQPAGALLPSGPYQFVLLWASDGSSVQTQSWNV